ncbi:MAG: D-alanyl-D-alanine carboxypeptidase family protein [Lachnospiraceae bacterium]|nr:D-alanyl-D-alanine carboxypeptidase family protein [Lachnospiraceae bacterium]
MNTMPKTRSRFFPAHTSYEHLSFGAKDVTRGSLILVNHRHPMQTMPAGSDLVDLNSGQRDLLSPHAGTFENAPACFEHPVEEVYLHKQAATMLFSLLKKSHAGGQVTAVSGYRSYTEQVSIWEDTLARKGISFTEKYVARPGCSEHQTGLAIDLAQTSPSIDYVCPAFPKEGAIASFCDMAPQFGFVLRYPKEKEAVTQIGYEPWHFRYVGFPHSVIMTKRHLVLEEYLEMLEAETSPLKPLTYTQDGARIDIIYLSMLNRQNIEIDFSDALPHTLSGTNKSGIVLTRFHRT